MTIAGQRCVLMGDPRHFSVKGGANPHTRTRWGTRRTVDRESAIRQWHALHDTLIDLGIRVFVVPPDSDWPGSVYPANAGYALDVDTPIPAADRRFYLANLLPTRAGEKAQYRIALAEAGIAPLEIDERLRFEGEADFFPAGDIHLLTHGRVEKQRFVPTWGIPPWKRVYGFRTDVDAEPALQQAIGERRILRVPLTLEAHYHGDTVLCAFGPGRKYLLGYREGVTEEAWHALEDRFADDLIALNTEDAQHYAANSFTYTTDTDSVLVMPDGISQHLTDQIRERGVTPIAVDVSEFLKKGGGSVKCMIGDLGVVGPPRNSETHEKFALSD
ncbi:MAG: arginine deiminase-related protein [Myxococcota bacterium]